MSVKVRAAFPWPNNHAGKGRTYIVPKGAGPTQHSRAVFTLGTPKEPRGWNCGTDVVWPVLQVDWPTKVANIDLENIYVCRHQIEAGD